MLNQLDHEEQEGVRIVLASIDCEVEITHIADTSYDIKLAWSLSHCGFVLDALNQPASLTMLCNGDDTLIHIYDSVIVLNILDVVSSCILPLQKRVKIVIQL
jgi:hypothetical protein